jgi:coronin-1B/1C/6
VEYFAEAHACFQSTTMSGRFVRPSKFRHVHGDPNKKDKAYLGAKAETTGEGNYITASTAYWAVAQPGGGGPVLAWPHKAFGRVDVNAPRINVHKAKVLDLEFSPFAERLLATASEDGSCKLSMIPEGGLQKDITEPVQSLEGHQKKLSIVRWHPTANNVLGTLSHDNTIKIWDVEKGKEIAGNMEHPDFPISMEWNEDGSLLATSCKDKYIRLFDPRSKVAASKTLGLEGTKGQRIVWISPLGKLMTIGFQKTNSRGYSLFDCKKLGEPIANADLDTAAGVFIPYYDPDTSMLYLAGKGDAAIKYWEITNEDPFVHFLSEYRDVESTKGACFVPKALCDVKSCEVAVCLRVMKDWISPVSFKVPRKSEMFQGDIFPDTYAGRPVMTADEWAAGTNKSPLKKSMRPGAAAPDSKIAAATSFSAPSKEVPNAKSAPDSKVASPNQPAPGGKSAAELQKELDVALARIKELEAQVAKLQSAQAPTTAPPS